MAVDNIGSAHTPGELAALIEIAKQRINANQHELDLGLEDRASAVIDLPASTAAVVKRSSPRILWQGLAGSYERLGLGVVADSVFRDLVLARLVEPTSKLDSVRVLGRLGLDPPHVNTLYNCLGRVIARDYRTLIAAACWRHVTAAGGPGVALLVARDGFPLDVHVFEGNKAETKTLIPVITAFQERHAIADMVVVADAGMLSAANLNASKTQVYCSSSAPAPPKRPRSSKSTSVAAATHRRRRDRGADPPDGARPRQARPPSGVALQVGARPAGSPHAQRADRPCSASGPPGRALEEAAVRQAHRTERHFGRGLDRTGSPSGRIQGVRHQYRLDDHGWPRRGGVVPRPVEGRAVVPDGQVRPQGQTGLPPDQGFHRGALDRGVRRAGGCPIPAEHHRRIDQEGRRRPRTPAHDRGRHRRPRDDRRAEHQRRRPQTHRCDKRGSPKVVELRPEIGAG